MTTSSPSSATWPSEQVVTAAQHGDEFAIALLVSGSHTNVRRFAHTLCSTPEDAEDAAQEALLILYRKIGTLRVAAALASWLFQIVRRECMRRVRSPVLVHADAAVEQSAEDAALMRLETERIVASIAALAPDQREVIVLRDVYGLSGDATADALGLSRAAMKSRLHRGREALRMQLEEMPVAGRIRSRP
ncbi:MAG TPA: RNA polymerase sigma factor [Solirubrobacteraceae bacterium]|nr:RNA polymerase sigma factor [Solirubrobacteraceae bacterium]